MTPSASTVPLSTQTVASRPPGEPRPPAATCAAYATGACAAGARVRPRQLGRGGLRVESGERARPPPGWRLPHQHPSEQVRSQVVQEPLRCFVSQQPGCLVITVKQAEQKQSRKGRHKPHRASPRAPSAFSPPSSPLSDTERESREAMERADIGGGCRPAAWGWAAGRERASTCGGAQQAPATQNVRGCGRSLRSKDKSTGPRGEDEAAQRRDRLWKTGRPCGQPVNGGTRVCNRRSQLPSPTWSSRYWCHAHSALGDVASTTGTWPG